MAITQEQNEAIIEIRRQLQDLLNKLNHLAREVGADPIPLVDGEVDTRPPPPVTPTPTPPPPARQL